jgi:hypothetical protein
MSRQYRIRVYGKQRKNIDPALLAQVVILFGRHLHQQRHQATEDTTAGKSPAASRSRGNPGVAHPEPPPDDTPLTPRNNEGERS